MPPIAVKPYVVKFFKAIAVALVDVIVGHLACQKGSRRPVP